MTIRATRKLLFSSGVWPMEKKTTLIKLPGEWMADSVSIEHLGLKVVYYFHLQMKISVIMKGCGLRETLSYLPERVNSLLRRQNAFELIPHLQLHDIPDFCTINSTQMVLQMNQLRSDLELQLCLMAEATCYECIEDVFFKRSIIKNNM